MNTLIIEFNFQTVNILNLYDLIKANLNNPNIFIKDIYIEAINNTSKVIRDINHIRTVTFLGFEYWFNEFFYMQNKDIDTKFISQFSSSLMQIKIVASSESHPFITTSHTKNQILNLIIQEVINKYS